MRNVWGIYKVAYLLAGVSYKAQGFGRRYNVFCHETIIPEVIKEICSNHKRNITILWSCVIEMMKTIIEIKYHYSDDDNDYV